MTFKLTINQALQQSDIARHEGRLDEVERLYREILKIEPNNKVAISTLKYLKKPVFN